MPRQAVLFLIDTQGTFVLGSYTGNPALGTPHLDRLASEGVRFNRAYTASPVCGPARSAIFTGLPPQITGVPNPGAASCAYRRDLRPDREVASRR